MRYPRVVTICLFLLACVLTAMSVLAIERSARQRQQAELEQYASDLQAAIESRVIANVAYLRSGAAMFAEIEPMSSNLFEKYVRNLQLDRSFRGSLGVGYTARFPAKYRDLAERKMKATYGAQARVWSQRPVSNNSIDAILFLEPKTPANVRAIGFNMYADPIRRVAMDRAEHSGQAAATAKVVLLQDQGPHPQPGFLIYMPVYRTDNGQPILRGFLYSPLRAGEFVSAALGLAHLPSGRIEIRDQESPLGDQLFALTKGPGLADGGVSVTRRIDVAQRSWLLKVTFPTLATLSPMGMAALLAGLTVSTLLLLITRMLLARAEEDRRALEFESQQAGIRDSLTRELNHRVKNTLANVLSIIALTRRRASDLDSFSESLTQRIRALSATHDLLTHSHWGTTLLSDVISVELMPYGLDRLVSQSGPPVNLAPNDALSLGMAVHELVTNAAKFGALSVPEGRVHVDWKLITKHLAQIDWREEGGPPVSSPISRGFGTELIEKIVAHELHSRVDLRFNPEGVSCRLVVPVRDVAEFRLRAPSGS